MSKLRDISIFNNKYVSETQKAGLLNFYIVNHEQLLYRDIKLFF